MTGASPEGGPYRSVPPQGPPRRAANGCLIWGLAGCGALVLVMFVAGVIFAKVAGKNGGISGLVAGEAAAPLCKEKLLSLQSALTTYRRDHKEQYPAKLADLIPNYLVDESSFSYKDSIGAHSIEYTPPSKESPEDAVVAGFETGSYQIASIQKSRIFVRLLKDGRIVMDQLARQDVP